MTLADATLEGCQMPMGKFNALLDIETDASIIGLRERIFARVSMEPNTGCWIWLNAAMFGYGITSYRGRCVRAHRLSYLLFKGKIGEQFVLDHLCRVRCCVNPDHLEIVSTRENLMRGESFSAINFKKTHCCNGHPLSEKNLRFLKGRNPNRICWICARAREKSRRQKR